MRWVIRLGIACDEMLVRSRHSGRNLSDSDAGIVSQHVIDRPNGCSMNRNESLAGRCILKRQRSQRSIRFEPTRMTHKASPQHLIVRNTWIVFERHDGYAGC